MIQEERRLERYLEGDHDRIATLCAGLTGARAQEIT